MNKQNIGTCVLLINNENKILLGKRKNTYKSGSYGLPGGRIELNEPMSEAVRREVLEETGLEIPDLEYVGVVRENQGDFDFIHFVFTKNIGDAEVKLCEPDKCEAWKWLDLNFDSDEILSGHVAAIELYLNKNKLADLTTAL